jgi:hypothetical protein
VTCDCFDGPSTSSASRHAEIREQQVLDLATMDFTAEDRTAGFHRPMEFKLKPTNEASVTHNVYMILEDVKALLKLPLDLQMETAAGNVRGSWRV